MTAGLRVAVVGAGPAGLFAAQALIEQAAALEPPLPVTVNVLDRLPTPYGLVRYGVAPDHPSIKSVTRNLRQILEHPRVRFLGGVRFGSDVTRAELLGCHDAVIYATGAARDRRLGTEGEDLPGSHAATDFVSWYSGHPDADPGAFTLDAESVAVIGAGNVALDVARILVKDPGLLRDTDVPQPVLEALEASKVRTVHVIARRGPAYAKFTAKELRELGELAGVEIVTRPEEISPAGFDGCGEGARLAESDRRVRANLAAIAGWQSRGSAEHERTLSVRFWLRPVRIGGTTEVSHLMVERTRLDEQGKLTGTGELATIPVQMVLRSVGYQSVPLDGVPFDSRTCTVPNSAGRVLGPGGVAQPGEYVAGWLKRGPSGVIGTNKLDAAETVRCLLADVMQGVAPGLAPRSARPSLAGVLADRGVTPVGYHEWLRVERAEADLAARLSRGERVKLAAQDVAVLSHHLPARVPPSGMLSADDGDRVVNSRPKA